MSTTETVDGVLKADGTLELVRKATLPPGRVRVTMVWDPSHSPLDVSAVGGESGGKVPESFLINANRLDRAGHRNAAMDLLYDRIDEMMRMNQFDRLDAVLGEALVDDLSIDVLLGTLTATLPARRRLRSRPDFLNRTALVLRARGEYEEGLLTGLD